MIPVDLLEDYLIDQEEGLKKLLTYFLNLVMQLEAIQQSGAEPYKRTESSGTNAASIKPVLYMCPRESPHNH